MPLHLATLGADEQRLYADLATDPLATDTPQILADVAEERGFERRAALLRQGPRLALLELLRGRALTEQECRELAPLEADLSAALGAPASEECIPRLLDPEGNLDAQRLREQYAFQMALLASLGLLSRQHGEPCVTGIDGRPYPVPSLREIEQALKSQVIREKMRQGFDQLLLVPFAAGTGSLTAAFRRGLIRNQHLFAEYEGLDCEAPIRAWEGFEAEQFIYFPRRFAPEHGGLTKTEILRSDPHAGCRVLMIEGGLAELPLASQGATVGGRRQIEAGRTPVRYLDEFPLGEEGWTHEAYFLAFLTALERDGRPLDSVTITLLTGSYIPASGRVPYTYWSPGIGQVSLDRRYQALDGPTYGPRAAVRVL